jgi:alkylation response protein AidB-like acyl-CoA dehydrogenase
VTAVYSTEHEAFRQSAAAFFGREVVPFYHQWERDGIVSRQLYERAAEHNFLAGAVPERHGGAGADDLRFTAVVVEEAERAGVGPVGLSLAMVTDICLSYLLHWCDERQASGWFPDIARGELILAIAMTEPEPVRAATITSPTLGSPTAERPRS